MKTFVNLFLLAIVAAVAIPHRASTVAPSPSPAPTPWVAPADPIVVKSCLCPNCGCGKECKCDGGTCRCEACVSAYGAARAKAERERLPMLCVVGMANCAPCRRLEATLATMDLSGFVVVHLDAQRDHAVVSALEIRQFPALVVSGPGPALEWKSTRIGAATTDQIRGEMGKAFPTVSSPILMTPVNYQPNWRPLRVSAVQMVSSGC